jgi:hypothetical protein
MLMEKVFIGFWSANEVLCGRAEHKQPRNQLRSALGHALAGSVEHFTFGALFLALRLGRANGQRQSQDDSRQL